MIKNPVETRRRIIDAGLALFYSASIAEVGVDEIAAKAGVSKKTLYYHYPSKTVLITACYEARREAVLGTYRSWAGEAGDARGAFKNLFSNLRDYVAEPAFHGCGFMRASAELASQREHPANAIVADYKKDVEAWFAEIIAADGYPRPAMLARQTMVLLDGCLAHVMFHRDTTYVEAAGDAVDALLARAKA